MASPSKKRELGYESAPPVPFASGAVLPEPADNCGIAKVVIPGGTRVAMPGRAPFVIQHTTLEGHRFAVARIEPGEHVLSWGLSFGVATSRLEPGHYLANVRLLASLRGRGITDLPASPNFNDLIKPHVIDESSFVPCPQTPLLEGAEAARWPGYSRPGGRGAGTRNYIILVGTTSLAAGYVKALEARFREGGWASKYPSIDGVVAVAHTEGGGVRGVKPHNFDLLCTTLAAFMVHPNVAAALAVDYGAPNEAVWNEDVAAAAASSGRKLEDVPHHFMRLTGDVESDLARGVDVVKEWLPAAGACTRTPQPFTELSVAQQCGGSDAFSGVSGNPCTGEACKVLIGMGGQAVLAETDELMGAESYVLERVKDLATARKFVTIVEAFKERLAWHGQSAEANPSGGNNYRGLYNIALKSLGAAKKKHADVSLDEVLAYGQSVVNAGRGYFMMDSPGNDLESIAGQVACGCNIIYFITGNGSITNFPFVPTIKIVTTTARFELLKSDMDFNAGRFQEGVPMLELGRELYDLTVATAGGAYSVGERAVSRGMGAQVSIWRNWPQGGPTDMAQYNHGPLHGVARGAPGGGHGSPVEFPGFAPPPGTSTRPTVERIGLILPTSLCSGEVAKKITDQMNALLAGKGTSPDPSVAALGRAVSRFVCLPHTEGCGTGYIEGGIAMYNRIMLGHLMHPAVAVALCLEHGCEKTHNDFFSGVLKEKGVDPALFGYASIQLDGGIDKVAAKVRAFFLDRAAPATTGGAGASNPPLPAASRTPCDLRRLSFGLLTPDISLEGPHGAALGDLAAGLVATIVGGGGSVVIPAGSALLSHPRVLLALGGGGDAAEPTLAFSQVPGGGGAHVMDMPSVNDWAETVTGLAGCGVDMVIALTQPPVQAGRAKPTPGHPIVPLVHLGVVAGGAPAVDAPSWVSGTDGVVDGVDAALAVLTRVAGGVAPKSASTAYFNVTRGVSGVST